MRTEVTRCHALQTLAASALVGIAGAARAQTALTPGRIPSRANVTHAVRTELVVAPEVSSNLIDVSDHDGVVTLTGSVPTLLDKRRAARVVETVRGVRAVVNRLEVSTPDRPDDQIRADIVRALAMDPAADAYQLDVRVRDQVARLGGTVESWHERELAGKVAASVRGVRDVLTDGVTVEYKHNRPDAEIRADVRSRLKWNRWIDPSQVRVAVEDGKVRLTGEVASAQEKRRARTMAWVSGVTSVDTSGLEVRPWADLPGKRSPEDIARLRDPDIARAVTDALRYDPRVLSSDITTDVAHGIATLTGRVGDLRARNAAAQDARNTAGVARVRNYLLVRPDRSLLAHDGLRGRVLEVIDRDPIVRRDGKSIRIENGTVYLMGDASSEGEAERASDIVSAVPGVVGVVNNLSTSREWDWKPDRELADEVRSQLFWSPFVDSNDITVTSENGVVTLTGQVDDFAEMAAARKNAWDADPKAVRLDLDLAGS